MKTKIAGVRLVKLLAAGLLVCGACGAMAAVELTPSASSAPGAVAGGINLEATVGSATMAAAPEAQGVSLPAAVSVEAVVPSEANGAPFGSPVAYEPNFAPVPEPSYMLSGAFALMAGLGGLVRRKLARA
jgi:hypothetical protein